MTSLIRLKLCQTSLTQPYCVEDLDGRLEAIWTQREEGRKNGVFLWRITFIDVGT